MGIFKRVADALQRRNKPDDRASPDDPEAESQQLLIAPHRNPWIDESRIATATLAELQAVIKNLLRKGLLSPEALQAQLDGLRIRVKTAVKEAINPEKVLAPEQGEKLLKTVEARFIKHNENEKFLGARKWATWAAVKAKLEANPEKLWSLNEMERTGGEPDVVGYDQQTGEYIFMDCSAETPSGRRSICYDEQGEQEAKNNGKKPEGNAVAVAKKMGITIATEKEYRHLQTLGTFDAQTWSWILTDEETRGSGVALNGSRVDPEMGVSRNVPNYFSRYRAFRGFMCV